MTDLIRIENRDGVQTVNARELHAFLEAKTQYKDWIRTRIEKYGFIENQDFVAVAEKKATAQGNETEYKVHYLSLDMAKELSMVENNTKGREARQYFIAVEKKAREIQKAMSPLDILKQQILLMEAQEKRLAETESRVTEIEARLETRQEGFYTVAGYASLRGMKIDVTRANILGRKAAKVSREYGYEIGKASDPKYGTVNTYHLDILSVVFDQDGTL